MGGRAVDLNADLGEGGPHDPALLEVVSSASVACGFHAGDPVTMLETAREAARLGVAVGAHPSYDDRKGFGRRPMDTTGEELFAAVVHQVGAMAATAAAAGTEVRFVKPHGALYNRAATDATVAEPVVRAAAALGLPVLCPPGSAMERVAPRFGVTVFREAFADRGYRPDGRLVGREAAGALIADPDRAAARAVVLVERGLVEAIDGSKISVAAESICIHGDTPGALELARAVRRALEAAGISIRPFAADPP